MNRPQSRARAILVADNDPESRKLARATLEKDGFRVLESEDNKSTLEVCERETPGLIVIAAELPPMDGYETCMAIRSLPGFESTAILLVTEHEDTGSVDRAFEAGATDVISAPANSALLSHRARFILRADETSRKVREGESKNRALIQASPDTVLVIDKDGKLLDRHAGRTSDFFAELSEHDQSTVFDVLPPKLATHWRQELKNVLNDGLPRNSKFRLTRNGVTGYFQARIAPYVDGQALVMIRDTTKQGQATARVQQLSLVDTLTGLRNRQAFLDGLAEAVRAAELNTTMLAVLCIDLDNFKRINDSLGHTVGDELLKIIADRLKSCVRRDDFVAHIGEGNSPHQLARLGGNEFTVILRDIHSALQAENVGERISAALSKPLAHGDHELVITASIGIAFYPDDGGDSESLLKNAYVAMHQAKTAGGNDQCLFSGTMSVRSLERLEIEDSLRRAIANDDLELHYQPKLGLASGQITGVEALLRWDHPDRGPISPAKFIPLAEDAGLILELSQWVLQTACNQLRDWQGGPVGEIPIAINLSSHQFNTSDVHSIVTKTLFEAQISPILLELELTEGALMQDAAQTIDTLNRLKKSGLSVAIDDFGTGYCSLSYLKKFPVDTLKIDRSFVAELHVGDDDASICKTIIALGHGLRLKVIAEGVENSEQLELLREYGCDEIQGYYFAKPQPADLTATFVLAHRNKATAPEGLPEPSKLEKFA